MPTTTPSSEALVAEANAEYKQAITALIDQHGSATAVPRDAWNRVADLCRAKTVLALNPDAPNKAALLRHYSVPATIIESLTGNPVAPVERRKRITDKYRDIERWCADHTLEQVTPDIIAEIGDISVGTATTFIKERVHLFRKVKRGLYEIRDPKADREAEA